MQSSSNFSQDNAEKLFFEQLRPGDFLDARYSDNEWKLANVIDRDQKYCVIIYDGYPPNSEEIYINPMRLKPLRSVTAGYTGPQKGVYSSLTSIPDLKQHLATVDSLLGAEELPQAYKVTQFLRGELFSIVNSLLMSELQFSEAETEKIYTFCIQLIDRLAKVVETALSYAPEYFDTPPNNKLVYLLKTQLAYVYSLQEVLHLLYCLIASGPDTPRLLKIYKVEISQQNLTSHLKQHLRLLARALNANDGNGRWLPTNSRVLIMKILLQFKREEQFLSIKYDVKDYIEYFAVWPSMNKLCPTRKNEEALVDFIINAVTKQSPFDAKLKSLQLLRRIMEKEIKMNFLNVSLISERLAKNNVLNSLLKSFNPEIFKRFIPILSIMSEHVKKPLLQEHVDELFKLMESRHESETPLIHDIIVSISEFIGVEVLDQIFMDIEKKIDFNSEAGIKFIRDFTVSAIENFNTHKNKGFLNALMGRKKSSSKYGYYGLNLFWKEIQDRTGIILPKNITLVISNIGAIFSHDVFHHERFPYLQLCLQNINKKTSYGQSVRLMHEIVCSYPTTAMLSDSQESIVLKLDEKQSIIDALIGGLRELDKKQDLKVSFNASVRHLYSFLEMFGYKLKHGMKLEHISFLWYLPHFFEFLMKPKAIPNTEIPVWKRKYFKKISNDLIKDILTKLVSQDEFIIPSEECFNSIDQLYLSYNLSIKSIELTERATIRYKALENSVGTTFYYSFLSKLIKLNSVDTYGALTMNVARRIFQLHLRPYNCDNIEGRCQIWLKCFKKVIKILAKSCQIEENSPEQAEKSCAQVLAAFELFLDLIQGRKAKDISVSGKQDVVVALESKERTISLPRNVTILKLRESIMEVFKLNCNFAMFNTAMKREITLFEEEDFSINAMIYPPKGPCIFIRRVEEAVLYHQHQAVKTFMRLIEEQDDLYDIVFGLLKMNCSAELNRRVWKLIDKLPTNRGFIKKIENCKDFTKKSWEDFLMPNQMQELLYSTNIILSLLAAPDWTNNFVASKGQVVIEELIIALLSSSDPNSEKIIIRLCQIATKVMEHSADFENQDKIYHKMIGRLRDAYLPKKPSMEEPPQQVNEPQQVRNEPLSIEATNLMMKYILLSSKSFGVPKAEELLAELKQNDLLVSMCEKVMFQDKNDDTCFFTEEVVEKILLQVIEEPSQKVSCFQQIAHAFLHFDFLRKQASVANFFIFLVDSLHLLSPQNDPDLYLPATKQLIMNYAYEAINLNGPRTEVSEEMAYGAFKLVSLTLSNDLFDYDKRRLFDSLVNRVFEGAKQETGSKIGNKNRKIMFDLMKKLIFMEKELLGVLTGRIEPKLRHADWRRNTYSFWSLEQQKKEKKNFCGLENLAATCYINCLFQQLFMIANFRDRFINVSSLAYRESPEANEIYQLQKLLTYLKYGTKRSYTTRQFCDSFITYEGVPIDPSVQNDADEFFNALMEKIENFLKEAHQHSILEDTFEGQLSNQLNCEGCPHNSEKIESFLSIGLNIKNKKTLEEALDGYVEGEMLDGDNAYYCEQCDKKVPTMKRLCIKSLPNILVVVLKRFSINFDDMTKLKINDQLKFPQDLNLKKYTSQYLLKEECQEECFYEYKLRGIVVHAGSSEAGHYYSFIKDQPTSKWFEFNDEVVEEADYKRIQEEAFGGEEKDSEFKFQKNRNAYILFYEKCIPNLTNSIESQATQSAGLKNKIDQKQTVEEEAHKNDRAGQMKEEETISQLGQAIPDMSEAIPDMGVLVEADQADEPFEKELAEMVLSENRNSEFLLVMLDPFFVRLCENISMVQSDEAPKFLFLYFHTTMLRDRNKEEYLSNIYRILLTLLQAQPTLANWFLQQIDQNYIQEFLIEAPKLVQYLCLGLLVEAIKLAEGQDYIVDHLIPCLILSLKKKGMTPYCKVFTFLSSQPRYRQCLLDLDYPTRVINLLWNKSSPLKMISVPKPSEGQGSFFGKDSSPKQKEVEFCPSFLAQSLKNFPQEVPELEAVNSFNNLSTRHTNRVFARIIAAHCEDSAKALLRMTTAEKRVRDDKFKRDDVQKYLFMIRELWSVEVEGSKEVKQACLRSLQETIEFNTNRYLFMELAILQINKLASRSQQFQNEWSALVKKTESLKSSLKYWIKESDRPQFLSMSDDWKRKVINLGYAEKDALLNKNRQTQETRTRWMLGEQHSPVEVSSEMELGKNGDEIVVGFKSYIVREQLGLLTKLEDEKKSVRWGLLERNDIECYIEF